MPTKRISTALVLLAIASGQECGRVLTLTSSPGKRLLRRSALRQLPSVPHVVGGVRAQLKVWPWVAAVYYKQDQYTSFHCAGSLVNRKFVLSAAHCFFEREPSDYLVRLGELDLESDSDGSQPIDVEMVNIYVHPDYSKAHYYKDAALLELSQEINLSAFVKPICLTRSLDLSESPSAFATVIGWGHTKFGGRRSSHLQEARVPLVSVTECDQHYSNLKSYQSVFPRGINDDFICAGNTTGGGVDACQGDSGGPLMAMDSKETWQLIGVVSFGVECGTSQYPGVYTRVTSVIPWIGRIFGQRKDLS